MSKEEDPGLVFKVSMESDDPRRALATKAQVARAMRMLEQPDVEFILLAVGNFDEEGTPMILPQDHRASAAVIAVSQDTAAGMLPELRRIIAELRKHAVHGTSVN